MTATQQTQYAWNYNETADLSQVAYFKILFWNNGICFMGFNNQHTIVVGKSLGFSTHISVDAFKSLILDEPLLGGGEPVVQVLLLSEKNLLIPEALFELEQVEDWFKAIHDVYEYETLEVSKMEKFRIVVLEAVRKDLVDEIEDVFPDAEVVGFSDCLVNVFDKDTFNIGVTVLGDKVHIQTYHQQKLHTFLLVDATAASVLHHISVFASGFGISQDDVKVFLCGYGDRVADIKAVLNDFFITESGLVDEPFFNTIAICAS